MTSAAPRSSPPTSGADVQRAVAAAEVESLSTAVAEESAFRIQSLARGLSVLAHVAASDGDLNAAELSRLTGVSRQTTYHLLHTLRQTGYLQQVRGQRYRLGWAVTTLVDGFNRQVTPPREALQLLRELVERSGEACSLSAWSGDDVLLIAKEPGVHPIRVADVYIGQHGALHARAAAKALLAQTEPSRREKIVSQLTFERYTANTTTDPVTFGAEIEQVSVQGYATDHEELIQGMTCVASAISVDGTDFALTILAPSDRYAIHADAYIDAVLSCAAAAPRQRTKPSLASTGHQPAHAAGHQQSGAVQ